MTEDEGGKKSDVANQDAGASRHQEAGPQAGLDVARLGISPEVLNRKLSRRWKGGARSKAAGAGGRAGVAAEGIAGAGGRIPHQGKMEAGFGEALGGVRAHVGPEARAASDKLGADAFTMGQDIAFRDENPSEHVVAHEVAHTIQQRGGGAGAAAGEVLTYGGSHSNPLEREADVAAQTVVSGGRARITGQTSGAAVQGFESMGDLKNQVVDAAEILWELMRLSQFHLFSGTFEGDLDVGKALYYAKIVHSGGFLGMLEFDTASRGSAVVHLVLNVYHRTLQISAKTLPLKGFHSPSFTSGASSLSDVVITGMAGASDVTVSIGGASMTDATFINGKDRVAAASVGLTGLHLDGNYSKSAAGQSVMAALGFGEAHVHGLRYPGLPATDIDVKQAGLTFDTLWSSVGAKAPPAPAGGALPAAPNVLPKDSKLHITLEGLKAAGTVGLGGAHPGVAAGGSFDHFAVTLTGADGKEQAAILLDGFHGAVTGSGERGTIDKVTVRGQPAMVKSLLDSDQIKAQPSVKQALDILQAAGIQPAAAGGTLTLQHVGMTAGKDGKATAKGDLAAHLVVPDTGTLDVALQGFHANVDEKSLAGAGGFDKFSATLAGKDGKELAYAELDGATGSTGTASVTAGTGTGAVQKFVVRGDIAGLLKAADAQLGKLPPQVKSALDSVRQLGMKGEVTGNVSGTAGKGTAQAGGDVSVHLDAGPDSLASLTLKGFQGDEKGGLGGATFTRLEANLTLKNKEAAFFSVDSGDANDKDKNIHFNAKKVEVRGDAAHLAALLGAVEKQAPSLPPSVKAACDIAQTYALDATGDLTLANVQVGTDAAGAPSVSADLAAKVQVQGVGELDATVKGFQEHPGKNGAKAVAFQRLEVTLDKNAGKEAAFFAAEGEARQGAADGSYGFSAKQIEARGDAASLSELFTAAGNHVKMLPDDIKAAFATVSEFGVVGKGDMKLTNVEVGGDADGTRAKADLTAGFDLTGAGKVAVVVHGFVGSATKTAKDVQFDSFEATLSDVKGTQTAHLLIEGSKDHLANAAPGQTGQPDMSFHAHDIQATGAAKDLAALFTAVQQHLKALPPQVVTAFDAVREYGDQFPAMANISLTDVDLGSDNGRVVANGDVSATVDVPQLGTLDARLKGSRGGDTPGFDSLDIQLSDKTGGAAATLHVAGVRVDAGGKSAHVDSIVIHGDGTRLHAVLDPKVQALLPPELAKSLALLDGNQLSAAMGNLNVKEDASGNATAGVDTIVLTAAVNFVDKQGAVYACPDASLMLSGAKVQLGPDKKPIEIDAAGMTASGKFTSKSQGGAASVQGTAKLVTGTVKVLMGPGGVPKSVVANDIQASGDIQTQQPAPKPQTPGPAPSKAQQIADIQKAEPAAMDAARLIKTADVHTQTPMFPGKYGKGIQIGVLPGTTLNVDLVARNNALASGTDANFKPALDLPLWLALRGVNLQTKGKEGVLKTDLRGFFDFNISKQVSGKSTLSLDITTLVKQVMDNLQTSIANAKAPSAKDAAANAKWLKQKHDKWASDAQHAAAAAVHKNAAKQKQVADDEAGEEPRSTDMADMASAKGMDVMATTGTADVELTTAKKATTVDGVTLPAGNDIHMHGQSSGGGKISLTADEVVAQAGQNELKASGLDTGNLTVASNDTGSHIQFDSFSLKQLSWDALTPSK